MLTPDYLLKVSDAALDAFVALDTALKVEAARAVSVEGVDRAAVRAAIAARSTARSRQLDSVVIRTLTDAAKLSLSGDEAIYEAARVAGLVAPFTPYADSVALRQVLNAGIARTTRLTNIVRTSAEQAVNASFIDALDTAVLQTLTGAAAGDAARDEAVRKIARTDTVVTYATEQGTLRQSLYSAVRRAVVTGSNQTVLQMQETRLHEIGARYVEVTAHSGARPEHAEWQGQVYLFDELGEATGYGAGDGLGGWNCRHSFYPYFPGIMEPTNHDALSDRDNDADYELSQRQRYAERNVRKYAGQAEVLRAGGLDDDAKRYDGLARKWRGEAATVAKQRGGAVRENRMRAEPTYK